jgi:hypothetical protein
MKRNRNFKDYYYSSPWLIVAVAVAMSNIIFLIIAWFFGIEELAMGLILTTVIPLTFGIPASLQIAKHHERLVDQKHEMQRLYALSKRIVSKLTKEIETPLLSMQKDLIRIQEKNGNSDLVEPLNNFEHKLEDMQQHLDRLLRWSKNEVDKENLTMELVSAGQVIHPIVDYMNDIIREKELKVKLVSMDESVRINLDMYNFIFRSIVEPAFEDSQYNDTIEVSIRNGSQAFDTIIRDRRAIEKMEELEQMNTPDSMDMEKPEEKPLSYSRLLTAIHYIYSLNGKLFITRNDEGINTTIIQLPH